MELPAYYTALFNSISDAIRAIEQMNFGLAREILMQAQMDAEDVYLAEGPEWEEEPEEESEEESEEE